LGLGIVHYIPLIAYLGFWVMSFVSLKGQPLYGLYYLIPFIPYRTMRDHFLIYPLGTNVLTILVLSIIVGALIHGKKLPQSKLYLVWFVFGAYLYLSMWLGTMISNAPAPLWITDVNFATWKDYMVIPLIFLASGLVIEDRKAVRTVILITAISVLFIDRSCLSESLSRSWTSFSEDKRGGGPLGYGSNQTAAYLAQFSMFFWGFALFLKRKKLKLLCYGLVVLTLFATMYTFSRGAYLAVLFSVLVLGLVKDRKLLLLLVVFLLTWQVVVPDAVRERVTMTETSNGQLESSANQRVVLWENAEQSMMSSPIVGTGFATFQLGQHLDDLKDTHNWYIKVMVETGAIGILIALILLLQMLWLSFRLFLRGADPLYKGLGLSLFLATWACIVANCFGDRWTYIEITAPLWVLFGAATRAIYLEQPDPEAMDASVALPPHMAYR
jgi:putative inorganic carbon (HCO3(-)) transporter